MTAYPRIISPGLFALVFLSVSVLACGGDAPESDRDVEGLARAAAVDPALFDTVQWEDPAQAVDRGATVYAYSCAKCHGDRGAGDGGYRLEGRLLRPPSFLAEDWRFAADPKGLKAYIHAGNNRGMPHWGEAGLQPRDIDAVARYIVRRLWSEG